MMMKKFSRVGLLLLSGALLFSCKSNNEADKPVVGAGSAYSGLYVSISSNSLRNVSQEDYSGREAESKITDLRLLSSAANKSWTESAQDGAGFWAEAAGKYTVKPWKTEAGKQTMAIMVNGTANYLGASIGTAKDFVLGGADDPAKDLADLSTDDAFVMTSKVAVKDIIKGKTEGEVKGGSAEADNVFGFEVERVVAQGIVMKGASLQNETADGKGEISNLEYAAANGAAKTYLFRNHAGGRTMSGSDEDIAYSEYKSAIHDEKADFTDYKDASAVADKLIRFGNINSKTTGVGDYSPKSVMDHATIATATKASGRGVYFLENSVDHTAFMANKDKGFYRMSYAKVYATYTPKEVLSWDESAQKMVSNKGVAGQDFYRGTNDGLIYKNKSDVKKADATQKYYTYTKGKCFYRVLWNRQLAEDGKTVANADTRRNNIYVLSITAIQKIGLPWDPTDPQDPALPKPTDSDEGDVDDIDDPSIEKQDTYMRVTAEILQWNKIEREVTLE